MLPQEKIWVRGTVFERVILVEEKSSFLLTSNRLLNGSHQFLIHFSDKFFSFEHLDDYSCRFVPVNREELLYHIERPSIKLISFFRKEIFPLPRFPLGISDIASAVRNHYRGQISLSDMQLDQSMNEIIDDLKSNHYDIIGLSATFGQQDLLETFLIRIKEELAYSPLVIAGGSLPSLNYAHLLKQYPKLIIGLGYGETTFRNLVDCWNGNIQLSEVNHIAYLEPETGRLHTTSKRTDDKFSYGLPELDLLNETLRLGGVMQLESSRGCTYRCSFCPRSHKGQWSGDTVGPLSTLLPSINKLFQRNPTTARKIFLVDEEFIGYSNNDADTEGRALGIATALQEQGFRFETSTRIDQVIRLRQSQQWHINRIEFWKSLRKTGLSRMLFGVESGVTSILKRFNKQTTAEQNRKAIRLLTALEIPLRLTYITFDPLMSMAELIESFYFQGSKDILLNPCQDFNADELYQSLEEDGFLKQKSSRRPLYEEISYMLVSMENLIGSSYLKMVEEAGLAGDYSYSMGRRHSRYLNSDIEIMSELSQQWVDRNFTLDYTLKSMMKISENHEYEIITNLRRIIKKYAYGLLAKMLTLINGNNDFLDYAGFQNSSQLKYLHGVFKSCNNMRDKRQILYEVMDEHHIELKIDLEHTFKAIENELAKQHALQIKLEFEKWIIRTKWQLINI